MAKRLFSLSMLQEYAANKGGKLISKEFINSTSFLIWSCKNGHKWRATALEVLGKKSGKGSWCPKCNTGSHNLISIEDIVDD